MVSPVYSIYFASLFFIWCHSLPGTATQYVSDTHENKFGSSIFLYQRSTYPRDCREVQDQCSSRNYTGVFMIKPDGYLDPFEAYCDFTDGSGGWTIIHRRVDGTNNFNRDWQSYKYGFGFLSREFWIGNEKLSFLTNQKKYQLVIQMTASNGTVIRLVCDNFRISDELSNYRLVNVGQYSAGAVHCPTPQINENVVANTNLGGEHQSYNEGDVIDFLCENSHIQRFDGPQQVQCRSGDWVETATGERMEIAPTCTTTGCGRPDINVGVIVHVGEDDIPIGNTQFFTEGEVVTSRCDNPRNQILIGQVRRRCTDGEWTGTSPTCVDSQLRMGVDNTILLDILPDGSFIVFPISGQVWINCRKPTGTPFGNDITITTNSTIQPNRRFVRNGNRLRRLVLYNPIPENSGTYTCRESSVTRSINIRFQDIRCAEPEPVSNGRWEHIKNNANRFTPTAYIFMERVRLHCNSGYRLSGIQDSQCNYRGVWSPPLASCMAN